MTPAGQARIRAALDELAEAIIAAVDEGRADPGPPRLLSIDEAAAALGLGRSALYGEISAGRLGSLLVGRRRLIPASAIAEFIAAAQPQETIDVGRSMRPPAA